MAGNNGLLDTRNLIVQQQTIPQVGADRLFDSLQAQLEYHNRLMNELLGLLCFPVSQPITRFGADGGGEAYPADEYSAVDAAAQQPGYSLGLPLRKYQYSLGWTREYLRRATVGEVQNAMDSSLRANYRLVIRLIRAALFTPVNSTFNDMKYGDLFVKALINADSSFIPPYNTTVFNGATHTHYLTSASTGPTLANTTTIENHLIEHGHNQSLVLYLNLAEESAMRALTPDFIPFQRPYIIEAVTGTFALPTPTAGTTDPTMANRAIGRIKDFEVRLRDWVPAGYAFAFAEYGPDSPLNPLARRMSEFAEDNAWAMRGEDDKYPLHQEWMEGWYGFGGYNRTNGVVMQYNNAGAYATPTIALI